MEDILGVGELSPDETRRLAKLAEALVVIFRAMVEAIRDEDEQ